MKRYAPLFMLMPFFLVTSVFAKKNSGTDINPTLIASCNLLGSGSDQAGAMPCIYYVQGFLAGTWNEHEITIAEIKQDISEGFFERATRTRLGERADRTKMTPVTYDCSSVPEPKARIIEVLSTSLLPPVETVHDIDAKIHDAIKMVCPSNE